MIWFVSIDPSRGSVAWPEQGLKKSFVSSFTPFFFSVHEKPFLVAKCDYLDNCCTKLSPVAQHNLSFVFDNAAHTLIFPQTLRTLEMKRVNSFTFFCAQSNSVGPIRESARVSFYSLNQVSMASKSCSSSKSHRRRLTICSAHFA